MIQIAKRLKRPKTSAVYKTYWSFACKRQDIFFKRFNGDKSPWTDDPILIKHKFTNAYRASDRVSQFLINKVIYKGDQNANEVFFRIILFKLFNKIETWELLEQGLGEISFKNYSFKKYNEILKGRIESGLSIYSGAYIMASGKSSFGYERKHQNHLRLLESMMRQNLAEKMTMEKSMEDVFIKLKDYPLFGDFLAYQFATDINYSSLTDFSEMDFVKPGPGASDGIAKCFDDLGDFSESDIIKWMSDQQHDEFGRLGLSFRDLWGRPLQLIDCQNLFCEVDKYSRVKHPTVNGLSNRKRIKQVFRLNDNCIDYCYPPKWGINHLIK